MSVRDKAAIVGLGATEFSKNSGRSEMRLAMEAINAALADAGLAPGDVDGIVSFEMDNNSEAEILRNLGGPHLRFFTKIGFGGGGAGGAIQQASLAVAAGVAETVICFRAMNERSGQRFGNPMLQNQVTAEQLLMSFHTVHGLQTAAAFTAMAMRRYMHETGATTDDFATISIAARKHAATNPRAWFYGKPITREDYHASRLIADPLRLLDCCQESDGAVAVVVTSLERAKDLRQRPVKIRAAAQGLGRGTCVLTNYYRPDIAPRDESRVVSEQLYRAAGLGPEDMDLAIIYDHFGPTLLPALEAYGFCAWGEAKDFIKDGAIEVGGRLPVNTNGGQVGEAYIHGMNGVGEAVRQLRGEAVNQVAGAANILVTAGNGVPTSAMILGV